MRGRLTASNCLLQKASRFLIFNFLVVVQMNQRSLDSVSKLKQWPGKTSDSRNTLKGASCEPSLPSRPNQPSQPHNTMHLVLSVSCLISTACVNHCGIYHCAEECVVRSAAACRWQLPSKLNPVASLCLDEKYTAIQLLNHDMQADG